MMKLNIQILATGEPKALRTDTQKKLEHFLRTNKAIDEAHVKLTYGRNIGGNKLCELYLKTGGKNIFTIEGSLSFDASVDKALRKMQARMDAQDATPVG